MKRTSSPQAISLIGLLFAVLFFCAIFYNFEEDFRAYTCLACKITNPNEYYLAFFIIYLIRFFIFVLSFLFLCASFSLISFEDDKITFFAFLYSKNIKIGDIQKIALYSPYGGSIAYGFYSEKRTLMGFSIYMVDRGFFEELLIHVIQKNPQITIEESVLERVDAKVKTWILENSSKPA